MSHPHYWEPKDGHRMETAKPYLNTVIWGTSAFAAGTYTVILVDLDQPVTNGSASMQFPHSGPTVFHCEGIQLLATGGTTTNGHIHFGLVTDLTGGTADIRLIGELHFSPTASANKQSQTETTEIKGPFNTNHLLQSANLVVDLSGDGKLGAGGGTTASCPCINGTTHAGLGDLVLYADFAGDSITDIVVTVRYWTGGV